MLKKVNNIDKPKEKEVKERVHKTALQTSSFYKNKIQVRKTNRG